MSRCPSRKYLWRCEQDTEDHETYPDGQLRHTNLKDGEEISSEWTTDQQEPE